METKLNYDYLIISDTKNGEKYYGGNQEWYSTFIKRLAGCGPTTASTITMYELRNNKNRDEYTKEEFLELMNELWEYITPGSHGVNKIEMYEQGYDRFVKEKGLKSSKSNVMNILAKSEQRPSNLEVFKFINEALENNHPVAFLNLDNGKEKNLDEWHWVTLVGIKYDEENGILEATITDEEKLHDINLGLWLETTNKDGGFIYYK